MSSREISVDELWAELKEARRLLTIERDKNWNDDMRAALTGLLARIAPEDWVNPWPRNALITAFEFANESARLRAERAEKEKSE